jgi:hypothetical protein
VDLGADYQVATVKIWSGDVPTRLSNSIVSIIDSQGNTQNSYRIGDATGKTMFEFHSTITSVLSRKVRVQLEGTNHLHMREVQVFDQSGDNVALGKTATQSSTAGSEAA